tara:strand:- start:230 stop:754 length:525 start_codon:yes stop_codon:yes gene_type:complete
MLTVYSLNPDQRLSVTIAIFFAEDVLSTFEKQHPEDMRPRKAIEAAKEWLTNPCPSTSYAASAAAASAASAAAAAARISAYSEAAAASAAASASSAASAAGAKSAAYYAADAASSAASSAGRRLYIHNKLVQLLPHIFEYKVYAWTSFEDPEQVFNLLSKENQQRFLFNLDHLV